MIVTNARCGLPRLNCEFTCLMIDEEEVRTLLYGLDTNKATGVDEISPEILNMAPDGISRSLTSLFNYTLQSGRIPRECKSASVTPVPNEGNARHVENYRQIVILPVVVMVLEKAIHRQLYNYLQATAYHLPFPMQCTARCCGRNAQRSSSRALNAFRTTKCTSFLQNHHVLTVTNSAKP